MFKDITVHKVIVYLLEAVIIKAIFIQGLATLVKKLFRWAFLRSMHEIMLFVHYKDKAMRKGHQSMPLDMCIDGLCGKYRNDQT